MRCASKWERRPEWRPKLITLEAAPERLSRISGLAPVIELFIKDSLFMEFKKCLPQYVSNNSNHWIQYGLLFLVGFWIGYDCLDDFEELMGDPLIIEMFGEVPTPKSFGNFLRAFTPENIKVLRKFLTQQSLCYRKKLKLKDSITFNIDSTDHEHHGDLIEGLEFNYKGKWCLDSLEVFDDEGFCYDFDLRPGATFSSQGSVEMMRGILEHRPVLPTMLGDNFRADSAFCFEEFITMAMAKHLKGTITAHDNMNWSKQVQFITNWKPWVYTEKELKKAQERGVVLPQIEVGYYMYAPGWAPSIKLPVVIKKTFVPYERLSRKQKAELLAEKKDPKLGLWKNYAVLSLMGLYPKTPQEIIEYHNPRANMENMIREEKIAFDLTHFPCKPMTANHAYALLGLSAHNFFRLMSLTDNKVRPQFAKALRYRFIHLPGRIVYREHKIFLKIPLTHLQEVQTWLERWAANSDPPLSVA